jgi:hypothetical protein
MKKKDKKKVTIDCSVGKSKVRQDMGTDVNKIMDTYRRTGQTPAPLDMGQFKDVSNIGTYQELHQRDIMARREFSRLSADIQKKFHYSIDELVKFVDNPDNFEECIKLGLFPAPQETPGQRNPPGKSPEDKAPADAKASDGDGAEK